MPKVKALLPDQKIKQQHKLLSAKCKRLMRANGITQKDVAEKTGLTQSAISHQLADGITVPLFIAIVNMTDVEPGEVMKMIQIGGF